MRIWAWLLVVAFVLTTVRLFAPLSETWDKILAWAAIVVWGVYVAAYLWEDWRKRQGDQASTAISSNDQT